MLGQHWSLRVSVHVSARLLLIRQCAGSGAQVDIQQAAWGDSAGLLSDACLRIKRPWQSCISSIGMTSWPCPIPCLTRSSRRTNTSILLKWSAELGVKQPSAKAFSSPTIGLVVAAGLDAAAASTHGTASIFPGHACSRPNTGTCKVHWSMSKRSGAQLRHEF